MHTSYQVQYAFDLNYDQLGIGKTSSWLTRIRLGLSALNKHRFNYNFINSPSCHLCGARNEDSLHFFFHCPAHSAPRAVMITRLENELNIDTRNKRDLMHIMLYGMHNILNDSHLYTILIEFLSETKRFGSTD